MEKFTTVTSKVIPLALKDVDTDMIIPAQYMTSVSREGYGENLFRRARDRDPNFPLNQKKFEGAQILAADNNFGCGSSREHAVWALLGGGIRVVIAKSFADIFYNNSGKNGLLLVTLESGEVDNILSQAEDGSLEVKVSLEEQSVTLPSGEALSFDYNSFRKHCLLQGLDDIDYINESRANIQDYRRAREDFRFYSTLSENR